MAQDEATQHRIDSLNQILENAAHLHDTTVARTYLLLTEDYYVSNQDTVIPLCKKVLAITSKGLKSNPSKKIKRSLLVSKASALNNIGAIYFNEGDIPNTLKYFHQSLKVEEKIGNEVGIAETLSNLGYIYNQNGDNVSALKYFNRSLNIRKKLKDREGMAVVLSNMGLVYYSETDTTKALEYFKKSLVIEEECGNKSGAATSYANVAAIYRNQGNLEQALEYYNKSLTINIELNNKPEQALIMYNLGIMYYDERDLTKALNYGLQSMELAEVLGYPKNIEDAADLLTKVYEKQGKGMKALEMYKVFIAMRDSVKNTAAQNAMIEQRLQYDFEKKEALTAVEHEKEIAIKDADKKKQNILIWSISIGLVLILVFAFFIAQRLRISNRQKKLIEEKNEENELLLGEIHHRVKNNLQVISSLLALQERSITDVKAKAAITEGRERVQSIGLIHKHLYQNNQFASIEMRGYVTHLVEGLVETLGQKSNPIAVKVDIDELHLDVDTAVPLGLLINELVVNALKHAYSDVSEPLLKISLKEHDGTTTWEVLDNGVGKKADLEEANSFGMKLIRSLSRQLGATIHIQENDGLSFGITLKTE